MSYAGCECCRPESTQDYWEYDGDTVIRHHRVPRVSLFDPRELRNGAVALVLSARRETEMVYEDGSKGRVTDTWKEGLRDGLAPQPSASTPVSGRAGGAGRRPWTGITTFHHGKILS